MRLSQTIDNSADIIDSRDVIARIEYLQDLVNEDDSGLDEDEREELGALVALENEAIGYAPDWRHGQALIRDSYFEDYAREMAEDIGAIERDTSWPATCIDWEKATRELQQDYASVDFAGVTYWIRS